MLHLPSVPVTQMSSPASASFCQAQWYPFREDIVMVTTMLLGLLSGISTNEIIFHLRNADRMPFANSSTHSEGVDSEVQERVCTTLEDPHRTNI